MHVNSVFDELGLVVKLATSSRTSHREIPRSNKNMQRMQGLSSLRRCDQVNQPKAPLNSAAIYPIIRSPINHLETGKRKTYQGHTFALRIPSLDHCRFVYTHKCSPIYYDGKASLMHNFTCPLSPNGRQASSM